MIIIEALSEFMTRGGPVLWLIAANAMIIGYIAIERFLFIQFSFPKSMEQRRIDWQLTDTHSTRQRIYLRRGLIAQARHDLSNPLRLLFLLVALCPMLGLLGTITGMMHVFDTVSVQGTTEVRSMASAISRATLPTMAGMVVALPGLYFSLQLTRLAERRLQRLTGPT